MFRNLILKLEANGLSHSDALPESVASDEILDNRVILRNKMEI